MSRALHFLKQPNLNEVKTANGFIRFEKDKDGTFLKIGKSLGEGLTKSMDLSLEEAHIIQDFLNKNIKAVPQ